MGNIGDLRPKLIYLLEYQIHNVMQLLVQQHLNLHQGDRQFRRQHRLVHFLIHQKSVLDLPFKIS